MVGETTFSMVIQIIAIALLIILVVVIFKNYGGNS